MTDSENPTSAALRSLADFEAPDRVWANIRAEQERRRAAAPGWARWALGLAAAVLIGIGMTWGIALRPNAAETAIAELIQESRRLEQQLYATPSPAMSPTSRVLSFRVSNIDAALERQVRERGFDIAAAGELLRARNDLLRTMVSLRSYAQQRSHQRPQEHSQPRDMPQSLRHSRDQSNPMSDAQGRARGVSHPPSPDAAFYREYLR